MNGYDLHRMRLNFRFDNPDKCKSIHSELFMYICDLWNRLGQKKQFGLPTQVTMELLGIGSYNTYTKAYQDLVDWGFIKEIQKSTNQYSSRIIAISKIDKATDKSLDKATIKATDETTDDIIKQRTNNKEQRKSTTFIAPTIEDVITYFKEKGYREDIAKKAFDYYDVANRSDSKGNKVKNWKQKMQSVWFKEENEIKVEYPNKIDWYYENVRSKLDRLTPNPGGQQSDEWMEVVNNAKAQYGEQFFLDAKTAYVKHQNSI